MNRPYIYRLSHKITNQFYIGYRSANKLPASLDLGFKYFTSSNTVRKIGFENFNIEFISEFDVASEAYDEEQKLIESNINNPLCLNKSYTKDGSLRRILINHSEETKKLIGDIKRGKPNPLKGIKLSEDRKIKLRKPKSTTLGMRIPKTEAHAANISKAKTGSNMPWLFGRLVSEETRIKLRNNIKHTEESKNKIGAAHKGTKHTNETKDRLRNVVTCFDIQNKKTVTITKSLFDEFKGTRYVGSNSSIKRDLLSK